MKTSPRYRRSAYLPRVTSRVVLQNALLLALSSLPAANALAADVTFDTTFGVGGVATFCVGAHGCFTQTNGLTVQADGRILLAGSTPHGAGGSDWLFARLNADGSLDDTFNGTGWVDLSIGPGTTKQCAATKAVVRREGKIFGVGWANDLATGGAFKDIEMVSLNANGSLDTGFGNGTGKKMIAFGVPSTALAVGLQSDGKTIVAGTQDQSGSGGSNQQMVVFRERVPGGFDSSYATAGLFSIPTGSKAGIPGAVTFLGAEQLVGYNDGNGHAMIAELHADGTLDTSFGDAGTGIQEIDVPDVLAASAPLRLIIVPAIGGGSRIAGVFLDTKGNSYVFRLLTNGHLDDDPLSSFWGVGYQKLSFPVADLTWDASGLLYAVEASGTGSVRLAIFNTSGQKLPFDAIPFAGTDVKITQMVAQPDGRFVVAGSVDGQAVVARFLHYTFSDLQPAPISCPAVTNAALSKRYSCTGTVTGMSAGAFVPVAADPSGALGGLGFVQQNQNIKIINNSAATPATTTTSTVVMGGFPGPSEAPWDIRGARTTVTLSVTTQ